MRPILDHYRSLHEKHFPENPADPIRNQRDIPIAKKRLKKYGVARVKNMIEFSIEKLKGKGYDTSLQACLAVWMHNSYFQEWSRIKNCFEQYKDMAEPPLVRWWEGEEPREKEPEAETPPITPDSPVKEEPEEAQAPKEESTDVAVDVPRTKTHTPEEGGVHDLDSLYWRVESIRDYFRSLCKERLGIEISRRKSDAAYLRNDVLPQYVGKDHPTFVKGIHVMDYAIEQFRNLTPRPIRVRLSDCFTEEMVNSYHEDAARKAAADPAGTDAGNNLSYGPQRG